MSEATHTQHDARLYNEDLAPVPLDKRTWGWMHFAALWVGMVVCVPSYTIAGGMIDQGMNWWQACLLVFLGNAIVLLPILLNAHAGTKYGIPFPVFARASFGVWGANIAAIARAIVACGWFGIQTWLGGSALYALFLALTGGTAPDHTVAGHFVGFGIFWCVNVYFVWRGTESIKFLETWAAPFLILSCLALLGWAIVKTPGLGAMLEATQPRRPGSFWALFWPNLTAMVGFWATLAINIPDFTRYAKNQREQMLGQAIGLPATMVLLAFVGVAVTGATILLFGRAIWNPTDLVGRLGSPVAVVVSTLALSVATLSTNIAANVVGPANDFANLAPGKISYRAGGLFTAVTGILMMPWKLLATSASYTFTWLIGYSALLGPIGGILIADYFVIRRGILQLDDLYRANGVYRYQGGFNPRALIALVLGVLPSLQGFSRALARAGGATLARNTWDSLYDAAWFVGFFGSALIYVALMLALPPKRAAS
ncbi:MAG: NCS1 family nucleobase:cation symporter-1 [Deltaproteobacteria bacterium]|nr:NCS1 family nucleobase:cation symporter-1 [Deltaproteobacteria bacterium]